MRKHELTTGLVGVAGEYLVAAELSRRGYIASLTLKNTRGIDILAASADASRAVSIQVKTSTGNRNSWLLNSKAETLNTDNFFYVRLSWQELMTRLNFSLFPEGKRLKNKP